MWWYCIQERLASDGAHTDVYMYGDWWVVGGEWWVVGGGSITLRAAEAYGKCMEGAGRIIRVAGAGRI